MAKIVFYIRALFHESLLGKIEGIDANVAVAMFNDVCNITAEEYRKNVHKIQLENLQEISPHIIVNHRDREVMSFGHIQHKAKEELLKLNDDDILIPLDDDDWISPKIKNFNFISGLTGWNTAGLVPDNWATLYYYRKHKQFLRTDITCEDDRKIFEAGLLSNCQAFSGKMVKQLIDNRALLQLHTKCRTIALAHGFDEHITDDRLSIYVKHACNITSLARHSLDEKSLKQNIMKYKFMYTYDLNLAGEYVWATKYMHKLAELNKQL